MNALTRALLLSQYSARTPALTCFRRKQELISHSVHGWDSLTLNLRLQTLNQVDKGGRKTKLLLYHIQYLSYKELSLPLV